MLQYYKGELCARTCEVVLFSSKGFDSQIKLDSRKYDNIGFTKESLREYINEILIGNRILAYYITKDKIITFRRQRWITFEKINYDLNNL